MQVKLSPAVRALANGAETGKDARPILKGVLVTETQAIVADGFMLIIKALPSPEMALSPISNDGIKQVIIPSDALKACDSGDVNLSTIESIRPRTGELDVKASPHIIARMDGEDFDLEAECIEGTYPDYKALLNANTETKAIIAMRTSLLKKLLKCLPDDHTLIFRISEPDKPVEFQCLDPDGDTPITGIVMPMNIATEQIKWHGEKLPDARAD